MLILAHRPFPAPQPYAETGPIFLCAEDCTRHEVGLPDPFLTGGRRTICSRVTRRTTASSTAPAAFVPTPTRSRLMRRTVLADPRVAYVHVRSARNNCYQFRIDRGASGAVIGLFRQGSPAAR
jgi:hypothetical protein